MNKEHKSIEELRKEFEKLVGTRADIINLPSTGDVVADRDRVILFEKVKTGIWNFFEPHLNSRNLLERLKELKMEKVENKGIFGVDWTHREGYNRAVDAINSKLDEFIESELNNE